VRFEVDVNKASHFRAIMEHYPLCNLVHFPLARGYESGTVGLGVMEHVDALKVRMTEDDDFLRQLSVDESIFKVFNDAVSGKIDIATAFKGLNDLMRSHVLTIERALDNRVEFAMGQKRRLLHAFDFIDPPTVKLTIVAQVEEDLEKALNLVRKWNTAWSDEVKEKAKEVGDLLEFKMAVATYIMVDQ